MKLLLIYKIILDIAYPLINDTFLYLWQNPIDFNIFKYIESFVLFIFLTRLIVKLENEVVGDLLLGLYSMSLIPMTTIYSFLNLDRKVLYIFFMCYLFLTLVCKLPIKEKKQIKLNIKFLAIFFMIIGVILLLYLNVSFGKLEISRAFHYKKLYELREKNELAGISKYIFYNYIYLGIPLILISIKNKFKHFFVIFTMIIMYIYIPRKIILVYLIVYYILYLFRGKIYIKLCSAYIIFFIITLMSKNILFIGMLDRVFYLPAYLSFIYWKFFEIRPFNYFAGSKIGILLQSKNIYGSYTHKISNIFWKNNMNANANFIASAYAEGGVVVIIICILVLSIILIIIKKTSKKLQQKDKEKLYILLLMNILILTNGPIWTLFLTNGFIVIIFIMGWIIFFR